MSQINSRNLRVEDVLAFHEYVRSIASCGIPVDLGLGDAASQVMQSLAGIGSRLSRANAQGIAIETVLRTDSSIPSEYREAILTWAHHRNLSSALTPLVGLGQGRRETVARVSSSLIQPVILAVMLYVGVWYMLRTLIPSMEAIYDQMREPSGFWLSKWLLLKRTEWAWLVGYPIALLAVAFLWRATRSRLSLRWQPDRILYADLHEKVSLSQRLVQKLELGLGHDSDYSVALPHSPSPLIHWALETSVRPDEQLDSIRFVEKLYRDSARSHTRRWNQWLPTIVSTFVGGLLVLCFALVVFGPLIELLYRLVLPRGAWQ